MRDHRKLTAFHLADRLAQEIYKHTTTFPGRESFGLVSQMRRAAVSVAANIVEGSARGTEKDYVRFLRYAFGSIRELGYYLELSRSLGYLSSSTAKELIKLQGRTAAALAALITSRRPD